MRHQELFQIRAHPLSKLDGPGEAALTEHVHLGDYAFQLHDLLEKGELALLRAVVNQLNKEDGVAKAEAWSRMRALAKQLKVSHPLWT
jgi:hypothetical protein